jgi:hypothetical protein
MGVLMAGVLFGATAAFAQAPAVPADVRINMKAPPPDFGAVRVSWTAASDLANLDHYEVQVRIWSATRQTDDLSGWLTSKTVAATSPNLRVDFTGLNYKKQYEARVRSVDATPADANTANSNWLMSMDDSTTDPVDDPWQSNPTIMQNEAHTLPSQPDLPVQPALPTVTVYDKMLGIEWNAPASDVTIQHYEVRYKVATASTWMTPSMVVTVTMATLDELTNGTQYALQVRAVNGDGRAGAWSATVMGTPSVSGGTTTTTTTTPALPLFGILALFGGLLAAGRARLRR